jgi:hypothetical protein
MSLVQVIHEIGNQILWNRMSWSKIFAQKGGNIFTNTGNVLENFLIFRQVHNLQSTGKIPGIIMHEII